MTPPSGPTRLGPGAEFDLIRRFLAGPAVLRPDVPVGPGDDAAVLRADGLAVSADASVEGVHFRREWLTFPEIGYRAAAAALSDLAAMAARPIGVLASLALPLRDFDAAPELMDGVREAAAAVGAALVGGDVTRSPTSLFLDVIALGEASAPVLRSGARPGDELWVTGVLGAAAAAVLAWSRGEEPPAAAREAFARPRPRVAAARWLAERGLAHAMLDLSDGLAGDATHLAAASGVRVVLEPALVPVAPAALVVAGNAEGALALALGGGEDYELCFAAPAGAVEPRRAEFEADLALGLARVGRIEEGEGVVASTADGERAPLPLTGYRHFQEGES